MRELVDWTLQQCTAMFKGSTHEDDWWLVRDGLLQWWHPVAQEHAVKIGLARHQLVMGAGNSHAGKIHMRVAGAVALASG